MFIKGAESDLRFWADWNPANAVSEVGGTSTGHPFFKNILPLFIIDIQ